MARKKIPISIYILPQTEKELRKLKPPHFSMSTFIVGAIEEWVVKQKGRKNGQ